MCRARSHRKLLQELGLSQSSVLSGKTTNVYRAPGYATTFSTRWDSVHTSQCVTGCSEGSRRDFMLVPGLSLRKAWEP